MREYTQRGSRQQLNVDYGGLIPVFHEERYRERGQALLELTRWAEKAKALVRDDPSLIDGVRADASRRSAVPSHGTPGKPCVARPTLRIKGHRHTRAQR